MNKLVNNRALEKQAMLKLAYGLCNKIDMSLKYKLISY